MSSSSMGLQEQGGLGVLGCLGILLLVGMFGFVLLAPREVVREWDYDLPQAQSVADAWVDTRAGTREKVDGVTLRYESHAECHGHECTEARDCFKTYGTLQIFFSGTDKRFARICQFPDGYMAVQFLAPDEYERGLMVEVSSYITHLIDNSYAGVRDWLARTGYTVYNGAIEWFQR